MLIERKVHFSDFRLDLTNEQLWRGEKELRLRPKTFQVLRYLIAHPRQLVTKEALLDAVWADVAVSDSMPAICVAELRKALGEERKTPSLIETVHGRGYRFIGKLEEPAPSLSQSDAGEPDPDCKMAAAPQGVPIRERRHLTVLFCELVGSTEGAEDLDPEEWGEVVAQYQHAIAEAISGFGGYVAKYPGDRIMALFGYPEAHENDPERAARAGLAIIAAITKVNEQVARAIFQSRISIDSGTVVVGPTGDGHIDVLGQAPNNAARALTVVVPGTVLVSEATAKLCEGYFELRELGPTTVKRVGTPVSVYEVLGPGRLRTHFELSARRGLTRFVGRERELEQMRRALEQSMAARGQIVAVVGEAGTGKSRLLFEFKAKNQSGWMVLEGFSVSHGKASAFLPVLDLLHSYFNITSEDHARTRREKVSGRVLALDQTLEDTLPYLFALLGIVEGMDPLAQMDAPIRRRRTQEAVKRILLRQSLDKPLMLIIEDLHWIDDETGAFLNVLVDGIANARVLLLASYRSEYRHEWGRKTFYTQLRVDPLGKESAEEMLSTLLGDAAQLVPLKDLIIEKTEGNPLFMEEIFQALLEDGSLKRNGELKLIRPVEQLRLPPTLQGILASRIDGLPVNEKDLLQTLAVIGKDFPLALAREVVKKGEVELERLMYGLQLAEFIYEQPGVAGLKYTFKHALTQEVAYNSILKDRRIALHERVARSIEEIFAGRLDDRLTELANHHVRAGNRGKAVFYLNLAAQRAMRGSAYGEAVALLKSGLDLIKNLPEDRARDRLENSLCLNLYQAAKVVQVHGLASEELLNRARYLCEKLEDHAGLFRALELLADHHGNRLDASGTRSVRDQLIRVASRIKDPPLLAHVRVGLGRTFLLEGRFKDAAQQFKLVPKQEDGDLASADRSILELMSHCYGMSAWNRWLLGYPLAALIESDKSVAISTALRSPRESARALAGRSALHLLMQNPEAALQDAKAALKVCHKEGLSWALQLSGLYHSWALIQRGDARSATVALLGGRTPIRGIAAQVRNRAARDGTWGGSSLTRFFTCLAEGCLRAGYVEPGLEVVDESLAVARISGVTMYEAETSRLKGELLIAKDTKSTGPAEECYRKAIDVARGQDAKSWELRATVSLARLLANTGRRVEAHAMLAEVYGWFTEGFDTADLKDAKTLLEELS
jgi:class 3 adenylate cyclase/tetratricopeptide (TPR) repeat protein